MFRSNPKLRLALYGIASIALGIVSTLNVLHIIDPATASGITTTINTIAGLLGLSAAGVAATNLGRQQVDGTFAVSGSPAEQLAQAAKNYADQRAADNAALDAVLAVVPGGSQIANAITGAVGTVTTAAANAVVTACGDSLR